MALTNQTKSSTVVTVCSCTSSMGSSSCPNSPSGLSAAVRSCVSHWHTLASICHSTCVLDGFAQRWKSMPFWLNDIIYVTNCNSLQLLELKDYHVPCVVATFHDWMTDTIVWPYQWCLDTDWMFLQNNAGHETKKNEAVVYFGYEKKFLIIAITFLTIISS